MSAFHRLVFALLVAAPLSACQLFGSGSAKTLTATPPGQAAACTALETFFRANIDKQWSGGLQALGNGLNGARKDVVEYARLADDESKKQMALAAVACEQFESGKLTVEQYNELLGKGLDAGVKVRLLSNGDAEKFLADFQAVLGQVRQDSTSNQQRFDALATKLDQTVQAEQDQLPTIASDAKAARASGEAARRFLEDLGDDSLDMAVLMRTMADSSSSFSTTALSRLDRMETSINALKARLQVVDEGETQRVVVPKVVGHVWFPVGTTPDPNSLRGLLSVLETYRSAASPTTSVKATVTGYSDLLGKTNDNLALSSRRAHVIADALRSAGVTDIQEAGQGATRQFGRGRLNRVVEVELTTTP